MRPLLSLCVFCLLPPALMLEDASQLPCVPRRSVPYHSDNVVLFREEGVFNYSNMLLREDLGLLVLGSRGAVFALDLKNIRNQFVSAQWKVSQKQVDDCKYKGKDPETECKNYIRVLHKMTDGRMYTCGTNAFDPKCKYISYAGEELTFEDSVEDGKGKCPFDPNQSYASVMVDDSLYSATSVNFLGSQPTLMRNFLRTEFKSSWLNEPSFVTMTHIPESEQSDDGDDDKVYLFFTEMAMECDCCNKLMVSRVARVCKGDQGGDRTLQNKWTSFLKARVDCPVLGSWVPYLIRDSYRWCDPKKNWKNCIFYAIFTAQSDASDLSAVCAYSVSDMSKVFSIGKYKTSVLVEASDVKWVTYNGEVPVPRPGACINNQARNMGITRSLDLPDQTLQFVKDKPLLDQPIQPIGGRPVLIRRGAAFTRIAVTQVRDAAGDMHRVMFIGTEDGAVLKAVNYDGEMFIIEEVHVFQSPQPIKNLQISNKMGQLYACSDSGVVQIPLATCERSQTCLDCVLARDPHCGWDAADGKCVLISASKSLIQSVKKGDASLCPVVEPIQPVAQSIWPGGDLKLSCPSSSNIAKISWEKDEEAVIPSTHLQLQQDGLLIFNASYNDDGSYHCLIVERSATNEYTTIGAKYQVHIDSSGLGKVGDVLAQTNGLSVSGLQAGVALLLIAFLALLAWNFYKRHIPLPCIRKNGRRKVPTDA